MESPHLPQAGVDRATPHIHLGRQGTGSNAASPAAIWRPHPGGMPQALRNETRDQSTLCRKSPHPGFHKYFSASSQIVRVSSILHYHMLQIFTESYLVPL